MSWTVKKYFPIPTWTVLCMLAFNKDYFKLASSAHQASPLVRFTCATIKLQAWMTLLWMAVLSPPVTPQQIQSAPLFCWGYQERSQHFLKYIGFWQNNVNKYREFFKRLWEALLLRNRMRVAIQSGCVPKILALKRWPRPLVTASAPKPPLLQTHLKHPQFNNSFHSRISRWETSRQPWPLQLD